MTIITKRKAISINFKKMASTIFTAVMTLFVAWFIISYFNVAFNNLNPDYVYPSWNLLVILFG